MVGRGQKRKQPSAEPSQELLVRESNSSIGGNSSSNVGSNDSVERLAQMMSDILQSSQNAVKLGTAKGDVIPEFNPEDREQNAERWLNKVDELRQIFNWSEEATMYFALSKLKGLAEVWVKGLQSMKFSWEEWKQKILVAFPSTRDYYEKLSDMMQRRKRYDENYSKYYYEKLTLLNQCKITGAEAVSCILGGIDDVVVKTSAKAGNYGTPEELYQYLSSLHNSRPSTSASRPIAKPIRRQDRQMNWNKREDNRRSGSKCFKCGKLGHLMRECRLKRCDFCRNLGHVESDCYLKRKGKPEGTKTVS